jgi:hypothetical protein
MRIRSTESWWFVLKRTFCWRTSVNWGSTTTEVNLPAVEKFHQHRAQTVKYIVNNVCGRIHPRFILEIRSSDRSKKMNPVCAANCRNCQGDTRSGVDVTSSVSTRYWTRNRHRVLVVEGSCDKRANLWFDWRCCFEGLPEPVGKCDKKDHWRRLTNSIAQPGSFTNACKDYTALFVCLFSAAAILFTKLASEPRNSWPELSRPRSACMTVTTTLGMVLQRPQQATLFHESDGSACLYILCTRRSSVHLDPTFHTYRATCPKSTPSTLFCLYNLVAYWFAHWHLT